MDDIGNGDALILAMQDLLREMSKSVIRLSKDIGANGADAEATARKIGEIRATKKYILRLSDIVRRAKSIRGIEEE